MKNIASQILLVLVGIAIPYIIEVIRGNAGKEQFKLLDFSKILCIVLAFYGLELTYYKTFGIEAINIYYFILSKLLLTISLIAAVRKFSPSSVSIRNHLLFPPHEKKIKYQFLIILSFTLTSLSSCLAVEFGGDMVKQQLLHVLILKWVLETPYTAIPIAILVLAISMVGEEIVNRYFAVNSLKVVLSKRAVIIISSLIWVLIHGEIDAPIFVFGVLLGYIYYETESLSLCVVLHFIFNCIVLTEPFYILYKEIGILEINVYQYGIVLMLSQILIYKFIETIFRILRNKVTTENRNI